MSQVLRGQKVKFHGPKDKSNLKRDRAPRIVSGIGAVQTLYTFQSLNELLTLKHEQCTKTFNISLPEQRSSFLSLNAYTEKLMEVLAISYLLNIPGQPSIKRMPPSFIPSSTTDWLSNSFSGTVQYYICNTVIPPYLKRAATLPCIQKLTTIFHKVV